MNRRFLFLPLYFLATGAFAQVSVLNLLTENRPNPIGLDVATPRLSWQLASAKRNVRQTAYEWKAKWIEPGYGWTSYATHLQYQVYDVMNLLKTGANAIGVTLASGWYRGRLAWEKQKNIYGKDLAVLGQLAITYTCLYVKASLCPPYFTARANRIGEPARAKPPIHPLPIHVWPLFSEFSFMHWGAMPPVRFIFRFGASRAGRGRVRGL